MIKKKSSLTGLLHPYSMEPKNVFIDRFFQDAGMKDLFPDPKRLAQMANQVFKERLLNAQVTVTKLDGSIFFID